MNYRHAYHAGNHTEVFKHSVLCLLIAELWKKTAPFTVLDTHAGAGEYNLLSPEAVKTGEALDGVGVVLNDSLPTATLYLDIIKRRNPHGLVHYPGSPAIVQSLLREQDRQIVCELRKDDVSHLRALFKNDGRVSVHYRDGYEAINALVPLPTKRGIVFIDPPYERKDEFSVLGRVLNYGIAKWPTGIFMAWYPLKGSNGIDQLRGAYNRKNPPTLCIEFLRQPINGQTLAGSGLLICNPPWQLDRKLGTLCEELGQAFGKAKASWKLDWWTQEHQT